MKPVLGHIEFEEGGEGPKVEEEPGDGEEGEIPRKGRVTQSIVVLKDAKRKENIAKQEQRWMELTEGRKGSGASASVGAPTEVTTTSTVTSTVSSTMTSTSESTTTKTATATVSSTVEGEPPVEGTRRSHKKKDGSKKDKDDDDKPMVH